MSSRKQNCSRERLALSGFGVSMVRRGAATTLLVLVCGTGFAPLPSAALAIDAGIRRAAPPCVGDCDNNSQVTVDEIITGLTIALGSASLDQCPRFDCDGTGQVRVDCIIEAIDAALNGCDPGPTPSRTRTSTPTPTSTATPIPTVTRTSTPANTPTVTPPQPGDSVTVFDSRSAFTSAARALLTDDYEDLGYAEFQDDAKMDAVKGLTRYKTTFFPDFDEVIATPNGHIYGGGFTSGSFQLDFTAPSLGGSGVHAVGFDFANNTPMPYVAFVSFADGTSRNFMLHASAFQFLSPPPDFVGLTSSVEITRIHIGLMNGGATSDNLFAIDNLSVAAPETATVTATATFTTTAMNMPTATATPTATRSPTPAAIQRATSTPPPTATPTPTGMSTFTATRTATPSLTSTPSPTRTSTVMATATRTVTRTATNTATAISTSTQSAAPSPSSTQTATATADSTATQTATASPASTPSPTRAPIDEAALAASARVATEPLFRLFDFQARVGTPGGVAGRSSVSGCQQFDCLAFGHVTGTEEDCCSGTLFTQSFSNCMFDDDQGRVVSLDGLFMLDSDSFDVCTGAVPVGARFTASLSSLTHEVFFPDGSFSSTFQELNETFEVTTGGCTVRQPEQLGFGIRGDGRRVIDGELQQFQSDGVGNVLVDSESDVHALEIVVGSTGQPDSCTVTAALNGSLTSADFRAGTQFSTDLTDLHVVQPPQSGALLLALNGTVGTDCLGVVTLSTIEPLRVAPGDTCFTGGRLQAQRGGGTAAVTYADSGLDFDFGADGSVDQHFAACTDVPADQCRTTTVGLCGACTAVNQCQVGLSCFSCSRNCTGNTGRCSLGDTFVTCEDGVF